MEEAATKVAVLGTGSWGTALATVLAERGHFVTMWGRSPDEVSAIAERHENGRYLPGLALAPTITATLDLAAALSGARIVVQVVPSQAARDVLDRAASLLRDDAIVVSAAKGIENGSLATMDEVIADVLPGPI